MDERDLKVSVLYMNDNMNSERSEPASLYSRESVCLVTGDPDATCDVGSLSEEQRLLCEVLEDPFALVYIIEKFDTMEIKYPEKFRLALIRIQIDSDLRLNQDIQKHQKRGYVARTIEKLLFSEIMLEIVKEQDIVIDE